MKLKALGLLLGFAFLLFLTACTVTTPPRGGSGPSGDEGFIYLASRQGKVFALNLEQRTQGRIFPAPGEWVYPDGESKGVKAIYGNPALAAGKLYIGTNNGVLYSLDQATGRELWNKTLLLDGGGAIIASPVVAGERLLVSSGNRVYALDRESGRYLWPEPFTAQGKVWAPPVVGQDKVYVASLDRSLYALDLATGKVLWQFSTQGALVAPPQLVEDRLYLGSLDRGIYAVEANQGRPLWPQPYRLGGWSWSQPLFWQEKIIVGGLNNKIYALDARQGELVWDQLFSSNLSTATVVENMLILGFRDGSVVGLDPASGQKKWDFKAPSPVLANLLVKEGLVYVTTEAGTVYAIDAAQGVGLWEFSFKGS